MHLECFIVWEVTLNGVEATLNFLSITLEASKNVFLAKKWLFNCLSVTFMSNRPRILWKYSRLASGASSDPEELDGTKFFDLAAFFFGCFRLFCGFPLTEKSLISLSELCSSSLNWIALANLLVNLNFGVFFILGGILSLEGFVAKAAREERMRKLQQQALKKKRNFYFLSGTFCRSLSVGHPPKTTKEARIE